MTRSETPPEPQSNAVRSDAARLPEASSRRTALGRRIAFGRARAWLAILFERLTVAGLPLASVLSLFAIVSWFGLFRLSGDMLRIAALAGFGLATLAAFVPLARLRLPGKAEAERRLERQSGLVHQAIAVLGDRPATDDPVGSVLFRRHQQTMAARIGPLDAGLPSPDIARHDPVGLRAVFACLLFVGWFFSASPYGGRLADGFYPAPVTADEVAGLRIDAWVTPPAYTGRAPVYLSAGQKADAAEHSVPQFSILTIRLSEAGEPPAIRRLIDGAIVDLVDETPVKPVPGAAPAAEPETARTGPRTLTLALDDSVSLTDGDRTIRLLVEPDRKPTIAFDKEPASTVRGALEISFEAKDDYGITEAHAEIVPLEGDPSAVGLYGAPEYRLDIPGNGRRAVKATTSRDLTAHPLSGRKVRVTLVATDAAGQTGRSTPRDIIMPARPFAMPLAASVAEQRQVFALDVRKTWRALDLGEAALTRPDEMIPVLTHYLAVRSAMMRLKLARDAEALKATADYYWEVARGIEDGELADAEKRLQDAQKALSEALERNASDEEIKQLMAELRAAMQNYLSELAKRNQNADGRQDNQMASRMLRSQDLEKMLDQLENLARSGARDEAQKLLNEMNRMMNNLQTARPNQQGEQGENPAREQIDRLGKIIQDQQRLMEETHRLEQALRDRQQFGDPGEGLDPGQDPFGEDGQPPGEQGEQGQQDDQAQTPDEPGSQPLDKMTAEQLRQMLKELKERQEALEKGLGEVQKKLGEMGMKPVPGFGEGQKRMKDAAGDLGRPDGEAAMGNQGKALEALRKGAGEMMQQMMQAQGQGQGQNPGQGMPGGQNRAGRDPLGRQNGETGENGQTADGSVKVPDEIDIQRAREILEEIRRKLSDGPSGTIERDYLERLLDMTRD